MGCRLSIKLKDKEIPVNLIAKAYYSSPLYKGRLKGMTQMSEELLLCDKVIDHKFIKTFMVAWGSEAIMPEFLIPGFTYIGLGALLSHRDPVREDITQTLLNALSRHTPNVIRALWALARKGPELDYYQNTWAFLKRYGVSLDQARDTGLIITTSHRVTIWPDPQLKEVLGQVDPNIILWMQADSTLSLAQKGEE
jgi:hypothetical protein